MHLEIITRILRRLAYLRFATWIDDQEVQCLRLGSPGCGWNVPASLVKEGATAICVGAGEDISFDVSLVSSGVMVYCLDPTPRARDHVARLLAGELVKTSDGHSYEMAHFDAGRFQFSPYGLWSRSEVQQFYKPRNDAHVSHSIVNLQGTDEYFEAECLKFSDFLEKSQIASVDILKLDVEGAEYAIIEDILLGSVLPRSIVVEFDEANHPKGLGFTGRILKCINTMRAHGYRLVHVESCNFTMVL